MAKHDYDDAVEAGYSLVVPDEQPAMMDSRFAVDVPVFSEHRYQLDPTTYTAITKRKLKAIAHLAENPIPKGGKADVKNSSGKVLYSYSYYRPDDVYAAANAALTAAGLDVTPTMRGTQALVTGKTSYGNPILTTRLYFDFVIACEEGVQVIPWIADSSMNDFSKSLQACLTYGHRLFLQHYLRIHVDVYAPGEEKGEAETWDNGFWKAIQALGYWNDPSGDVDRNRFFGDMRQHWPENRRPAPELNEESAPLIYGWAKKHTASSGDVSEKQAPAEPATKEQPAPDAKPATDTQPARPEGDEATDDLLDALDEQFGIDRTPEGEPDLIEYTDAPADPPDYKTENWQERFWNDIARLGYWTNEDGEVNRHHFHASRRKWYEDRPEKIPSLVYDNAGLIYRWAWNYATHKALSERAEQGEPETEQPESE